MMSIEHPTLSVLRFENLSQFPEVRHFVSTRHGGFSAPPFDSLNLGFNTADSSRNVLRNRERLSSAAEIPLGAFVTLKQVHGSNVRVVTSDMAGLGASDYETALDDTDAVVTGAEEVCLMVRVADCVPVLFLDPVRRVIGAAHAGWRGTVQLIGAEVVQTMVRDFGSRPEDILAGIGPSIGQCCYQVGPEVVAQFCEVFGGGLIHGEDREGRGFLDLWEANRRQLLESGLRAENIETAGVCSRCRSDIFFSERAQPGTGRGGAGIMLLNETCASCTAINCTWCRRQ